MPRVTHYLNNILRDSIILGIIVLSSSLLFFYKIDNNYITLWDEAIQLNVVKNLSIDCCKPVLHNKDYNTDFRNWTDNYIWLHKPPFPLIVNSLFYKILGRNLLAYRLPNLIFIEISVVLVYLIGKDFFNKFTAAGASSLFAFNHYTYELVQGRQFSGISDIFLVTFLLLSLYLIFKISQNPKRIYFVGFGVSQGLAFLSKDGLALMPFLILIIILIKSRTNINFKSIILNLLYAFSICLFFIAGEKLILFNYFPSQYTYESQVQITHIFKNVEYWGRPWYFYLKDYWKILFGSIIGIVAYIALAVNFLKIKNNQKILILVSWILCYLTLLSFMVSKISNFLFPVVPVVYLLVCYTLYNIFKKNSFFKTACVLIIFLFIGRSVTANITSSQSIPYDFQAQMSLKDASIEIKNSLPLNAILLVNWPGVDKSHLYSKYWSDYESFEIYFYHPYWDWLNLLENRKNIYLLTKKPQDQAGILVRNLSEGFLYKLR